MNPTRLILARHDQAHCNLHCNLHGIIGGPRGRTDLTNHGHRPAQQLAERPHADHTQTAITAAHTTPLQRARETANIIADHLGRVRPTYVVSSVVALWCPPPAGRRHCGVTAGDEVTTSSREQLVRGQADLYRRRASAEERKRRGSMPS